MICQVVFGENADMNSNVRNASSKSKKHPAKPGMLLACSSVESKRLFPAQRSALDSSIPEMRGVPMPVAIS